MTQIKISLEVNLNTLDILPHYPSSVGDEVTCWLVLRSIGRDRTLVELFCHTLLSQSYTAPRKVSSTANVAVNLDEMLRVTWKDSLLIEENQQ